MLDTCILSRDLKRAPKGSKRFETLSLPLCEFFQETHPALEKQAKHFIHETIKYYSVAYSVRMECSSQCSVLRFRIRHLADASQLGAHVIHFWCGERRGSFVHELSQPGTAFTAQNCQSKMQASAVCAALLHILPAASILTCTLTAQQSRRYYGPMIATQPQRKPFYLQHLQLKLQFKTMLKTRASSKIR